MPRKPRKRNTKTAALLRKGLYKSGLSLYQAADRIGVEQPTVWAWVWGICVPEPRRHGVICRVLGIERKTLERAWREDKFSWYLYEERPSVKGAVASVLIAVGIAIALNDLASGGVGAALALVHPLSLIGPTLLTLSLFGHLSPLRRVS